jgi:hypothetical protein
MANANRDIVIKRKKHDYNFDVFHIHSIEIDFQKELDDFETKHNFNIKTPITYPKCL